MKKLLSLNEQHKLITSALAVIENEGLAILKLQENLNEQFIKACQLILACEGRVVVTGMGKSGHIAGKIAATLASTGTPAFYIHPGEASHGDLGMITTKDVVLALSYSGETQEIQLILPFLKRMHIPLIAMTGNIKSVLASTADVHLSIDINKEACPLGLAPTTSTTAMLAMGDALAVSLLEHKGFTAKDFALSHPGGSLGKRLLLKIEDIMRKNDEIPCVNPETSIAKTLIEISEKRLGMTLVADENKTLLGIYTDGDLRRTIENNIDIHHTLIQDIMTLSCKTTEAETLAIDALQIMESHKISVLPVINKSNQVVGIVHLHDLLKAGIS